MLLAGPWSIYQNQSGLHPVTAARASSKRWWKHGVGRRGRWEWCWRWRHHHVKYWGNLSVLWAEIFAWLSSSLGINYDDLWCCHKIRYLTCFYGGGVTAMTPDVPFHDLNVSLSRLCCRPLMSWRGRCTVSVKKTRLLRQKWGSRLCPRWWRSSTTCRMASGTRSLRKSAFKMFLRYLKVNPVFFWSDSETLDTQTALLEEKYEGKIANLQMNLKRFYCEELAVSFPYFPTLWFELKYNKSNIISIFFRRKNRRLKSCLLSLIK